MIFRTLPGFITKEYPYRVQALENNYHLGAECHYNIPAIYETDTASKWFFFDNFYKKLFKGLSTCDEEAEVMHSVFLLSEFINWVYKEIENIKKCGKCNVLAFLPNIVKKMKWDSCYGDIDVLGGGIFSSTKPSVFCDYLIDRIDNASEHFVKDIFKTIVNNKEYGKNVYFYDEIATVTYNEQQIFDNSYNDKIIKVIYNKNMIKYNHSTKGAVYYPEEYFNRVYDLYFREKDKIKDKDEILEFMEGSGSGHFKNFLDVYVGEYKKDWKEFIRKSKFMGGRSFTERINELDEVIDFFYDLQIYAFKEELSEEEYARLDLMRKIRKDVIAHLKAEEAMLEAEKEYELEAEEAMLEAQEDYEGILEESGFEDGDYTIFDLGKEYAEYLKEGPVCDELVKAFKEHGYYIWNGELKKVSSYAWLVKHHISSDSGLYGEYIIEEEDNKLIVSYN